MSCYMSIAYEDSILHYAVAQPHCLSQLHNSRVLRRYQHEQMRSMNNGITLWI